MAEPVELSGKLNDGTTSSAPRPGMDADHQYGDSTAPQGDLLSAKDSTVVKAVEELWNAQNVYFQKHLAQWKVNILQHMGVPGVSLRKTSLGWIKYVEPGMGPERVPIINKTAELIRKFVSVLYADPPVSIPQADDTTDEAVYASQVSRRALRYVNGEDMLSDEVQARRAFMKACDYGSAFRHFYVDPTGGDRVPIKVQAHPEATNVLFALKNPLTNKPLPGPYVPKFVTPNGALSDKESDAATKTLPVLKDEILTGRNIRLIPYTSLDIWKAEGVLIGKFTPWSTLKNLYGELVGLPDEKEQNILSFRPAFAKDIATKGQNLQLADRADDTLVWTVTVYMRRSYEYPHGACVIVVGNNAVVWKKPFSFKRADGTEEDFILPVTQYIQFDEGRDDPYKVGLTEIVASGQEQRVSQMAAILDQVDRINNRKIFLPYTSNVKQEDYEDRHKKLMLVGGGGTPTFEEVPNAPRDAWTIFQTAGQEMTESFGMGRTASGMEVPSVKSGRQAVAIMQQASASMSEPQKNIQRAALRADRIKLQLMRAYFTTSRPAAWMNDDEDFKMDAWTGDDLGNTRKVTLQPGTGTLLSPAAKAQLAEHYFQLGLLTRDKMYLIFSGELGGTIGLEEDGTRDRVHRQIAAWKQGPPPGWQPPQAPVQQDPNTGQMVPIFDPQTQQPMPAPPDPVSTQIWAPVPSDQLPDHATIRVTEMARLMESSKYMQYPQGWRAAVETEFDNMLRILTQMNLISAIENKSKIVATVDGQQEMQMLEGQPVQAGSPFQSGTKTYASSGEPKLSQAADQTGLNDLNARR